MSWVNVRRTVVVDAGPDPRQGIVLALGRSILRRTQGVGLYVVHGADGAPEHSYGGAYAGPIQPSITGATNGIGSTTVTRDLGGADIATGPTMQASGASRQFAERLRRGRTVA